MYLYRAATGKSNRILTAILLEKRKEDAGSDVKLVVTEALWNYWSSLQQILTKSLRGNLLCE